MRPATAAIISIVDKVVIVLLTIFSLAVLGRLLTPLEFGVVGIIVAVQTLLQPIVELGLIPAYIRIEALEKGTANVFFVMNVALGALNAIILVCLAPVLSSTYSAPILVPLTFIFAMSVFVHSFGRQPQAHLTRKKRFGVVMIINALAKAAGIVASIILAYKGFSVGALVFANVVTAVVGSLLLQIASGQHYRIPSYRCILADISGLRFGFLLTVTRLLGGIQRSFDSLFIGKFYGPDVLGYYSKALQLAMMPDVYMRNPLADVAFPYLCRLDEGLERRSGSYKVFLSILLLGPAMLSLLLLFMGDYSIVFIMGPAWESAGIFVRFLSLLGIGLIVRGGVATIYYCEDKMGSWVFINLIGIVFCLGLPVACYVAGGTNTLFFVGVFSGASLCYWAGVFICIGCRHIQRQDFVMLLRTTGLMVGSVLLAGGIARSIVETTVYVQSTFSKLFCVLVSGLAAVVLIQILLNRDELTLIYHYAKKRQIEQSRENV